MCGKYCQICGHNKVYSLGGVCVFPISTPEGVSCCGCGGDGK